MSQTTVKGSLIEILEEVSKSLKLLSVNKMDANKAKATAAILKQSNVAISNNIDIMKSMHKTSGDIEKYSLVPLGEADKK